LTKRRSLAGELFAADSTVGDILWLERAGRHRGLAGIWSLADDLREARFDTCWVLHKSMRYALAARLAGIPRQVGYASGPKSLLYTHPVRLSAEETLAHPIRKADMLLDRLGLTERERESEPTLVTDAALCATLAGRYRNRPRPWIAIGIGSSEPFKQWGEQCFVELCVQLQNAGSTSTLFVLGGPAEETMGTAIVEQLNGHEIDVVPILDRPLREAAALISLCDLYVGNDTATLNLAGATGVDAIGLFGGSPPLDYSSRIKVLLPAGGEPPRTGLNQMHLITVDTVTAVVRDRLARGK
jgi:heptosyltransferase-2